MILFWFEMLLVAIGASMIFKCDPLLSWGSYLVCWAFLMAINNPKKLFVA